MVQHKKCKVQFHYNNFLYKMLSVTEYSLACLIVTLITNVFYNAIITLLIGKYTKEGSNNE